MINPAPLANASTIIQLHTAAAIFAAACGLLVVILHKGTRQHKAIGYGFVATILFTAISSFWITEIFPGRFSAIHVLAVVILLSIPIAIYFRRRGQIRAHAMFMIGPLIGLFIAGGATLLPDRILHAVFFG